MATTISPHNNTSTIVQRSAAVADPPVVAEPIEVAGPILHPGSEGPNWSWIDRFRRTDPALPSPRDLVLAHADPNHTVRSIQR